MFDWLGMIYTLHAQARAHARTQCQLLDWKKNTEEEEKNMKCAEMHTMSGHHSPEWLPIDVVKSEGFKELVWYLEP